MDFSYCYLISINYDLNNVAVFVVRSSHHCWRAFMIVTHAMIEDGFLQSS